MSLRLKSTGAFLNDGNWPVMIYGDNRSGKTFFAGTWPRPVFLVPEISENEMRTLAEWDFPVVLFGDTADFQKQCESLIKLIRAGKPVGPYKPRTLVIDNLTTAQMMWEEDIKAKMGKEKLEWSDWGGVKSLTQRAITEFKRLPIHQLWICHTRKFSTAVKGASGRDERVEEGTWTLNGSTKEVLPHHCDLLLYSECIDRGAKGPGYIMHGRKRGIWPAGVRLNRIHADKPFTKIGPEPSPCYDDLAPYLGLPSLEDEEKEG
jgi:hypothetical protein